MQSGDVVLAATAAQKASALPSESRTTLHQYAVALQTPGLRRPATPRSRRYENADDFLKAKPRMF